MYPPFCAAGKAGGLARDIAQFWGFGVSGTAATTWACTAATHSCCPTSPAASGRCATGSTADKRVTGLQSAGAARAPTRPLRWCLVANLDRAFVKQLVATAACLPAERRGRRAQPISNAAGGYSLYSGVVFAGQLPSGLTPTSGGLISGTPV